MINIYQYNTSLGLLYLVSTVTFHNHMHVLFLSLWENLNNILIIMKSN